MGQEAVEVAPSCPRQNRDCFWLTCFQRVAHPFNWAHPSTLKPLGATRGKDELGRLTCFETKDRPLIGSSHSLPPN